MDKHADSLEVGRGFQRISFFLFSIYASQGYNIVLCCAVWQVIAAAALVVAASALALGETSTPAPAPALASSASSTSATTAKSLLFALQFFHVIHQSSVFGSGSLPRGHA